MAMQPDAPNAKPVVALMGEFSAGKSTLANLLICQGRSPVKVTATQRPPVWYSYGTGDPYIVDMRGEVTVITDDDLDDVPVETTNYIKVFVEADILEIFDIIDMPGNSDPNMSSDVWRRAIRHADAVIWCSHATQAWRQSEAAVWDEMPPSLYDTSILLLTRYDKLLTDSDRRRVVARVRKETDGLFRELFPISLIEAMEAGDNHDQWVASGADAFIRCLLDLTDDIQSGTIAPRPPAAPKPDEARPLRAVADPVDAPVAARTLDGDGPQDALSTAGIAPKRVERPSAPSRRRPPRTDSGPARL